MIEDYWNANPAFDVLLDHQPTMDYIHGIVKQRPTINNSEIRIRYQATPPAATAAPLQPAKSTATATPITASTA